MISATAEPFSTACLECDQLLDIPALQPGERANCPRCGHLITSHIKDGFDRSMAFALAGVVLLLVACSFLLDKEPYALRIREFRRQQGLDRQLARRCK